MIYMFLSNNLLSVDINLLNLSCYMHCSKMDNRVDPDQLASQKPPDLELTCFPNEIYMHPDLTRY